MNKGFDEYIVSKIEEIHGRKKGKVEPDFVLFVELQNEIIADLKTTLNRFYKEKRYKIGKTLNDKYIKDENWYGDTKV